MLTSLAYIFLLGLFFATLCQKLKLPRIIGMIATGILLGPYVFNLLSSHILSISSQLRQMALIIILLKAGLSLDVHDLKKIGRPAILMSCLPATFEIVAFFLFAPWLLHISPMEAALMGSVLAAVSPAVVVPRMVHLMETNWGTKKGIPQLIMAGASCDDVFVIVLFSTFVTMVQGGHASLSDFIGIPVSIILGILLGIVSGYFLASLFEINYHRKHHIRNSTKVIILLSASFLLLEIETRSAPIVSISGLLAVISMAVLLKTKCIDKVSKRLSEKLGKLWIAAELILFVLVGAAVDIRYTLRAGIPAIMLIFIALFFRALGVFLCLLKTPLTFKERLFCAIAYMPKATVQAAIGSVPLSLGLPCGPIILSVAVLGIIITAPLGALGIDTTYKKLLKE